MTTHSEDPRITLGKAFHTALAAGDWPGLRATLTDGCVWIVPGDNGISGEINGGDDITAGLRRIAGYGLDFGLEHVLLSRDNMCIALHNTAEHNGARLDEHLAVACEVRDGRIARMETYLSDVDGLDTFFA